MHRTGGEVTDAQPLTPRLRMVMMAIQRFFDEQGVAPSYEELCPLIGIVGRGTAFKLVLRLEEKGYIRRARGINRGIEILHRLDRPPDGELAAYRAALKRIVKNGMTASEIRALASDTLKEFNAV